MRWTGLLSIILIFFFELIPEKSGKWSIRHGSVEAQFLGLVAMLGYSLFVAGLLKIIVGKMPVRCYFRSAPFLSIVLVGIAGMFHTASGIRIPLRFLLSLPFVLLAFVLSATAGAEDGFECSRNEEERQRWSCAKPFFISFLPILLLYSLQYPVKIMFLTDRITALYGFFWIALLVISCFWIVEILRRYSALQDYSVSFAFFLLISGFWLNRIVYSLAPMFDISFFLFWSVVVYFLHLLFFQKVFDHSRPIARIFP